MQNQTQNSEALTEELFRLAAKAAETNLSAAVDLVVVHNEKIINAPDLKQPRVSLNRAIVVTAVGAWDRFVADVKDICTGQYDPESWGSGISSSTPKQLYAKPASALLAQAATERPFLDRIRVNAATTGSGVRLQKMEELVGGQRGLHSGLTFSQHLNQWILLRNALAHNSVPREVKRAENPGVWGDPDIGDPYASTCSDWPRWRLWHSDSVGDRSASEETRLVGATVQAWSARSCLAFIIQLVNWLITDIAEAHGRGWDPEHLRLPSAWFSRDLPDEFRGQTRDSFPGKDRHGQPLTSYAHWSLWEGPELYRRLQHTAAAAACGQIRGSDRRHTSPAFDSTIVPGSHRELPELLRLAAACALCEVVR